MRGSGQRNAWKAGAGCAAIVVCAAWAAGASPEPASAEAPVPAVRIVAAEVVAQQAAAIPITSGVAVPSAPSSPDPRSLPATKAATKIMNLRAAISESLTETVYQHRTVVRRDEGIYKWDCSGMTAWMLRRAAPVARKAIAKGRPVARDFYRHIRRQPTRRARDGWKRIDHIQDVRPGDVFAWQRPPNFKSKSTGHVGFAVEPPRPVAEWPGAYTLRILDATSLRHDRDTRPPGGEGGWGEGTILFMTDGDGHGTAYGWFGRRSRGVIVTEIVFGRVSR